MTDPELASPPCQAPPGYWDPDDEAVPAEGRAAETDGDRHRQGRRDCQVGEREIVNVEK